MNRTQKLEFIKKFKKAVEKIVVTGHMPGHHGICYAIDEIEPDTDSYGIMATVLTHREYSDGLGDGGDFNVDRQGFILLLYAMTERDILKCWENYEKFYHLSK